MKKLWLVVCILLLGHASGIAQAITDKQTLYHQAESLLQSNGEKSKKIAEYLLKNAASDAEKANATWLLAGINTLKADYPLAVDQLFEAKAYAFATGDANLKNKILISIAGQCTILGLDEQAKTYLAQAVAQQDPITNNPEKTISKDPHAAIAAALASLPTIEKQTDVLAIAAVYKTLADNYSALNDNSNYMLYSQKYDAINDNAISNREKAAIAMVSHMEKDMENDYFHTKQQHLIVLCSIAGALLLLGGAGIFYLRSLGGDYRQYQKIVTSLDEAAVMQPQAIPTPETRTYAMPEKTEKMLLEKLARFEESGKFVNRSMSLHHLAKQLDTNTKYLSEIINTHKNTNFSNYINELRIKYIINKLNTDPVYLNYKVSYLAEECGFSSHSLFATVFKSVTGISPAAYISFVKKEKLTLQEA